MADPELQHGSDVVRGDTLVDQGDFAAAAVCYRRALARDPENAEVRGYLARCLLESGQAEAAEREYTALCAMRPEEWKPQHGRALARLDRGEELGDEHGVAANGAAAALFDYGRHEQAQVLLRRRLQDAAGDGVALLLLARIEDLVGDAGGARALFLRGLSVPRPPAEAVRFYVQHLIRNAAMPEAQQFYESLVPRPQVAGQTVLVRNNGGLGDAIQAIGFMRLLRAAGARTIFECQAGLVELLRRTECADEVVAPQACAEPVDVSMTGVEVPLLFSWAPQAAWRPYVHADPALVARVRRQLGPSTKLRVGVAWRGMQLWRRDAHRYRSVPLPALAPIAAIPDVELCSLQYGAGEQEMGAAGFAICELDRTTMDATAASMAALDVVVTIDSVMAHLACAMGKPCLVMLPSSADWRWMNHPSETVFYPTARLFRQPAPGDWSSVAVAVAGAVQELRGDQSLAGAEGLTSRTADG